MKRSRLSYDEWKCILSKELYGKRIHTDAFNGYVGLLKIKEVSEPQIWNRRGEEVVVCDKGLQWLSILPENDHYCITAMLNEQGKILDWYIDMIAGQGTDKDGVVYFDDLYLDLIVYSDGTILVDDMDELEEALAVQDISQEQFDLAIETAERLKEGLLSDIAAFKQFTETCLKLVL